MSITICSSLHATDGNGKVGKSGCQPVLGHSSLPCAVPSQWEAGRAPAASIPVTLPVPFLWHRVSGALRVKRVSQASLVWMGWMLRANWYSILFSYPLLCMPPYSVFTLWHSSHMHSWHNVKVFSLFFNILTGLWVEWGNGRYSVTHPSDTYRACATWNIINCFKLLCFVHCIHNLVATSFTISPAYTISDLSPPQ